MPLAPDSDDRLALTDPGGHVLARLRLDGDRSAYDLERAPDAAVDDVAAGVLIELAGTHVAAPPGLAEALVARGGRRGRHAHLHSRDLRADPAPGGWADVAPPAGTRVAPVQGVDPDLIDAVDAAYPVGHADRDDEMPEEAVARIVSGTALGPLLPCSGALLAADGRACAGALITDRPGTPPWAGPWLTLIFRHPERAPRGAGRLLLTRALGVATIDGLPSLSLVVTEGNPARQLYESLGLRHVTTTINVALP